jgi:hypothetical protein
VVLPDEWDVGDAPTIYIDFVDNAGTPANPTSVTLRVRRPDGTVDVLPTTPTAVGHYEAVVPLDAHGTWRYRWEGTGAVQAAEEGELLVRRSRVLSG